MSEPQNALLPRVTEWLRRPRIARLIGMSCTLAIIAASQHDWHPAQTAYNEGYAHAAHGRLQEAIDDFDRAIKIRPQWGQPYLAKGAALRKLGESKRAIASQDNAIALGVANAYYERGLARKATGDLTGAVSDFKEAIALANDTSSAAYFEHGALLIRNGSINDGLANLDRAIAGQSQPEWLAERAKVKFFNLQAYAAAADDFAKAAHEAINRRDVTELLNHATSDSDQPPLQPEIGLDINRLLLWTHVTRVAAGVDDNEEMRTLALELSAPIHRELMLSLPPVDNLEAVAPTRALKAWPGPVYAGFLGLASESEIEQQAREAAEKDPGATRCDLPFYLSVLNGKDHSSSKGLDLLKAAAAACPDMSFEERFAKAELARSHN